MATGIDLPARADVAIIGGGFAGCATAWALADRGVGSVILERESELGRHASGRGAGLGRQLTENDGTSVLSIRGAHLLRSRFRPVWKQTGGLLGFEDPQLAEEYIARAKRLDILHVVVDRMAVLSHWPVFAGLRISAAIHLPTDGIIDTRVLLAQLAAGANVVYEAPVIRVTDGRIETARGTLEARVVVDAAGAWAGAATGDPPLETYKRHLFVLQTRPLAAAPYYWHLGSEELYVRAQGQDLLVSPCDATVTEPADQQPTPDGDACLAARLRISAPLSSAPVVQRWACQRAFTPDRRMRLGRDPRRPWLVWAVGLGGHGATAAPAVGERVAEAVIAALG